MIPNSKGNPFIGGVKYKGRENLEIFDGVGDGENRLFISETVRDRPMVTMER